MCESGFNSYALAPDFFAYLSFHLSLSLAFQAVDSDALIAIFKRHAWLNARTLVGTLARTRNPLEMSIGMGGR